MNRRSGLGLSFLLLLALLLEPVSRSSLDSLTPTAWRRSLARPASFRCIEGRLTGGFPYAPYGSRNGLSQPRDLRLAILRLSRQIAGTSPQATADRAVLLLIAGAPRQAVKLLEKAVAALPERAAFASDLAAAYLADARRNGDPYSRVKALEAAENAVTLDPGLPEARFNRALALASVSLPGQAAGAWKDYLALDRQTGWAKEAREHGRSPGASAAGRWVEQTRDLALAVPGSATVLRIVERFPQAAREHGEERLLGEWARAESAQRPVEAERKLALAGAIGAALARVNGESLLAAAVAVIRQAASASPRRYGLLIEGHAAYQAGLEVYARGQFSPSRDLFLRARSLLVQAGSPFVPWVDFRLAVCEMQLLHYPRALERLSGLESASARSLAGRALWLRGLIAVIQDRPAEALAAYRASLQSFTTLREEENQAVVRSLLAESLTDLGDLPAAWQAEMSALDSLAGMREPARRQSVLEQASVTALQGGQPAAALLFLQEALGSREPPATAASFYCLRSRALTNSRLGRFEAAHQDLETARTVVGRFDDLAARQSMAADLEAAEGRIHARRDPRAALPRLTAAIRSYENTAYHFQLALLLAERARAYLAVGQDAAGEGDLQAAIGEALKERTAVDDPALRSSYLDELRSIFDEMVALQARLGRAGRALEYSEMSRAQLLRESIAGSRGEAAPSLPGTREIQQSLPEGVALIELSVLPGRLLVWVLRHGSLDLYSQAIVAQDLKSLSERFQASIQTGRSGYAPDSDARHLSRLLLGDLGPSLRDARELVLVLDRGLYGVPFAALPDPFSGRPLIEKYALVLAPSASIHADALMHRRPARSWSTASVLVAGDPELDRSLLESLPRLPAAGNEAREIATFYPHARLVTGKQATAEIFLDGLRRFDLIHFAGHAIVNSTAPNASFLALASSAKRSGIVYARELDALRGVRARLVILSSCSSLSGGSNGAEGAMSLARSLVGSGVPAVVESLWAVDDRSAEVLFQEFHRSLIAGTRPAESLRRAQVKLLTKQDEFGFYSAAWASYRFFGVDQ